MKNLIKKDLLKRKLVSKLEDEKLLFKAIHSNLEIPLKIRIGVFYKSSLLPRNASKVRMRNRSLINGKSRAIITHTGLDRISLRNSILKGEIPGYLPHS